MLKFLSINRIHEFFNQFDLLTTKTYGVRNVPVDIKECFFT